MKARPWVPGVMIKTHVHGFFNTDIHEVSQHFAAHEAVSWVLSSTARVKIVVKEPIQNIFYPTPKMQIHPLYPLKTISKIGDLPSTIAITAHFWCAHSCPHNLTLRDWWRLWPTLTWLDKLVGAAKSSNIRNANFPHTLRTLGHVWDNI